MVPPGTGGSDSFVQQRQEQRSGMGHAPSRPLHPGDLSSGPTTGHPGAAWEGRLLEPLCPDPDAAGSSCTIFQAASTDFSAANCCGAFSAQSRPCQRAEPGAAATGPQQNSQPHPQNRGSAGTAALGRVSPPAMAMAARGLTAPSPSRAGWK